MRVLAVTTWLPTPDHPAAGTFVVKDARAIASLGHDLALVHLVPPHQGTVGDGGLAVRDEIGGLPLTRIPMATTRPDQVLAAGMALRPLLGQADLVHSMAFSTLLPLSTARPRAPWVHTEHWSGLTAPQTLPRAWRLALPALRWLHRGPDVVTAVCDYLARPIRRVRGARPTTVVPCVVPAPEGGLVERPGSGRAGSGRPSSDRLDLVDIGALVERKDPLLAVDVVAELVARGHDAHLRLVGQGDLATAIPGRASSRDVGDRVTVVGPRDRAGVLGELARADLFLGPTRGDNFFVSCAEALVSGRPVVVGSTGGQGEYIQPSVGRTVDVQDARAYADAVEAVLASTEGWTAQDIADTIGDRFEPGTVARGYQGAYELAVRRAGQR